MSVAVSYMFLSRIKLQKCFCLARTLMLLSTVSECRALAGEQILESVELKLNSVDRVVFTRVNSRCLYSICYK